MLMKVPEADDTAGIKNLLVRNGYSVTAVCTSGAKVLSTISEYNDGIVICGYKLTDIFKKQVWIGFVTEAFKKLSQRKYMQADLYKILYVMG